MNLKHHTLMKIPGCQTVNGRARWILIANDGCPVLGFDLFSQSLVRQKGQYSKNTVEQYCQHTARFFDYLAEVAEVAPQMEYKTLDAFFLQEVIEAYPDFLTSGVHNSSELISKVAENLKQKPLSPKSLSPHLAAINQFLDKSENYRLQLLELQANGEDLGLISDEELFPYARKRVEMGQHQRSAINKKSIVASVISGGAKLKSLVTLKAPASSQSQSQSQSQGNKDFPAEEFVNLIQNGFTNNRDRALYSLLGAAGLRLCEGLLVIFRDLDVKNREVFVPDPKTRPLSDYNYAFTAQDKDELEYKGRETLRTLLIEPWGSMFWHYFNEYLQEEFLPTSDHPFVFQKTHRDYRGQPLYAADKKSMRDTFKDALKRIGLPTHYSAHSLRHMYGVFLRNYYPNRKGGHGLDAETVKEIMGHALLDSTLGYAKVDMDLLRSKHQLGLLMKTSPSNLKLRATASMLEDRLQQVQALIESDKCNQPILLEGN
ncbi:tyrosine-type recombinase/integrase [Photobacterium swingsii]|uniref:tyrosine-type recombinase/integrase n=1 Tax=Photobacterium swingsii TaxID=680026 RepID=UPI00352D08D0